MSKYTSAVHRGTAISPHWPTAQTLSGSKTAQNTTTTTVCSRTTPAPFKNMAKAPPRHSRTVQSAQAANKAMGTTTLPPVQKSITGALTRLSKAAPMNAAPVVRSKLQRSVLRTKAWSSRASASAYAPQNGVLKMARGWDTSSKRRCATPSTATCAAPKRLETIRASAPVAIMPPTCSKKNKPPSRHKPGTTCAASVAHPFRRKSPLRCSITSKPRLAMVCIPKLTSTKVAILAWAWAARPRPINAKTDPAAALACAR